MKCPKCKNLNTHVLDSRETNEATSIRRRRECEKCKHRFTTFEKVEYKNLIVVKRDEAREPYSREKLERGIWRACEKRPVTQAQVDAVLNKLEEKWRNQGREVPSEIIGGSIMEELKNLDEVAYIRFASVYRQFKDIDSFQKELEKLHTK